jgi:hypothetical protein
MDLHIRKAARRQMHRVRAARRPLGLVAGIVAALILAPAAWARSGDNGVVLNWNINVPEAGPTTVSLVSDFSATGRLVGYPGVPVVASGAPVVGGSGVALAGTVDPDGLATSAHFEYGLDPRYASGGPVVYDGVTPAVSVGSGLGPVAVSASVSGLVPNAAYHVRLVATNDAGTVTGSDQTFTTTALAPPPPPVLGRSFDVKPVSGVVLVKLPAGRSGYVAGGELSKGVGFVPLTQARRLPAGSLVDARRGTLELTAAAPTSAPHAKLQTGTFSNGLYKLTQAGSGVHKGLTTLTLTEAAFPGAPSYASCRVGKQARVVGVPAKLSPKVLLTLSGHDNHGSFRTRGRFSAATVRGTEWSMGDRCDGTLTRVKRGVVDVFVFARRKTIVLHAGQRFLAPLV